MLDTMFKANSIAIIGVSQEPQKVGHLVAKNLLAQGYKGNVYFINPKGGTFFDKHIYKNIEEVGQPIELAVLCVPSTVALPYLDELKKYNVHNVVIFAAGFKETGLEGAEMEKKLYAAAKANNMQILGPNCIGFINTSEHINVTFLKHVCPPGNIGFLSQSGAIGSVMLDYFAAHENIGFSHFISLGNKTVIDESDVLLYLAESDEAKVIGMYVEDIKDGDKFRSVLEKVTRRKPVVVLKSGSTKEGSQAALSHTGGLVGDDDVYDAVFRQYGVIRASTYTEFITILKMASFNKMPSSSSVLVLSNAGGVGVLLADQLVKNGLTLTTISESTRAKLEAAFGTSKKISLHNPIDVLGDASAFDYKLAIDQTIQEKDIGSIVILLTPQANTEISETAKVVVATQKHFDKPVYPAFMGEKSLAGTYHYFDRQGMVGFPSYDYIPSALAKIVKWKQYTQSKDKSAKSVVLSKLSIMSAGTRVPEILTESKGKPFLNLSQSMEILSLAGVAVSQVQAVTNENELKDIGDKVGYPLVAKISSDTITHKTEIKGVIPWIKSYQELEQAYIALSKIDNNTHTAQVLLQKMVSGYEMFIGAKRDPTFGIVLVVGTGGIYTELMKDVSYRVFPFSKDEFTSMISETKLKTIIKGYRGSSPVDLDALYSSCIAVGQLMKQFPQIKEIDINPVMVSSSDIQAVDCRIILV